AAPSVAGPLSRRSGAGPRHRPPLRRRRAPRRPDLPRRREAEGARGLLAAEGVAARAYPADVTDEKGLTSALNRAAEELGRIGVLSYSPAPTFPNVPGQVPGLKALGFPSARDAFEAAVSG
ncbi:hypothetical protein ACFCYQ_35440, partial [Streptomyces scopuliridis]